MEPDRIKGIIGIEMPLRSIEEVADADGACPRFARVDRKNLRQRRHRPRVLVVADPTPTCTRESRCPQQPDAISS